MNNEKAAGASSERHADKASTNNETAEESCGVSAISAYGGRISARCATSKMAYWCNNASCKEMKIMAK